MAITKRFQPQEFVGVLGEGDVLTHFYLRGTLHFEDDEEGAVNPDPRRHQVELTPREAEKFIDKSAITAAEQIRDLGERLGAHSEKAKYIERLEAERNSFADNAANLEAETVKAKADLADLRRETSKEIDVLKSQLEGERERAKADIQKLRSELLRIGAHIASLKLNEEA